MTDPVADTVAYYNRQAAEFAAQTAELDLGPLYDQFLRHVRPGGRTLDAGCGVGRDTLAFAERGYEVVAFDASEAMVRLARSGVGDRAAVHLMRFGDVARRIRRRLGLRVTAARAVGVVPRCRIAAHRRAQAGWRLVHVL